jgi:hypothetical protein
VYPDRITYQRAQPAVADLGKGGTILKEIILLKSGASSSQMKNEGDDMWSTQMYPALFEQESSGPRWNTPRSRPTYFDSLEGACS